MRWREGSKTNKRQREGSDTKKLARKIKDGLASETH